MPSLSQVMADRLLDEGIYVIGFFYPVVPKDTARIRVQLSAAHTDAHIAQALAVLANMAEQMVRAGGDMARLGGVMRRLVNGERDADQLLKGMGPLGRQLLLDILNELGRSGLH
jgi:hypothetical protein